MKKSLLNRILFGLVIPSEFVSFVDVMKIGLMVVSAALAATAMNLVITNHQPFASLSTYQILLAGFVGIVFVGKNVEYWEHIRKKSSLLVDLGFLMLISSVIVPYWIPISTIFLYAGVVLGNLTLFFLPEEVSHVFPEERPARRV